MKKSYVLIGIFLIIIVITSIIGSFIVSGSKKIDEGKNIFEFQERKEAYMTGYGYTFDNPNVIVNPYGNSPLTAIVMFETDSYEKVETILKGKNGGNDINYKFDESKYHAIPIYGLYADFDNVVIIRLNGKEKSIHIKTEKLPDDFKRVDNELKDNFVFYNNNYPYAIDSAGEVRWYLNQHYYGNITSISNSNIIIGSDRYLEDGNTISFYKMSLLGKIYNEYLLQEGYYGYNTIYKDNILALSDSLLLIDIQTGEVIERIAETEDYNRDENTKTSFYDNTLNFKIVPSKVYGSLKKTETSSNRIMLIGYKNVKEMKDINITKEENRIVVENKSDSKIYVIFDKFLDKKIYEVENIKYINTEGLHGKYTIYYKIADKIYKTDYYIEV